MLNVPESFHPRPDETIVPADDSEAWDKIDVVDNHLLVVINQKGWGKTCLKPAFGQESSRCQGPNSAFTSEKDGFDPHIHPRKLKIYKQMISINRNRGLKLHFFPQNSQPYLGMVGFPSQVEEDEAMDEFEPLSTDCGAPKP